MDEKVVINAYCKKVMKNDIRYILFAISVGDLDLIEDVYAGVWDAGVSEKDMLTSFVTELQGDLETKPAINEALRSDEYDLNIYTNDVYILEAFKNDPYIQKGSFVNIRVLQTPLDNYDDASAIDKLLIYLMQRR